MARKTSRKKRGTEHPLRVWRKANNVTQQGLVALISEAKGRASQGLITRWETGETRITPERAIDVERATKGGVPRQVLRPDLWPVVDASVDA